MGADFQISYTLDMLLYIGCLIDEKKSAFYEADVQQFMPMLGTVSDKYLAKLTKVNKRTPGFIEHIVSILIVNDHLHDWRIVDLLDRPHRLVVVFKKAKQFDHAAKDLKKFLKRDFLKVIPLVTTIIHDLERLGFKKFWLEKKLPHLKERTSEYQKILDEFNIVEHVNGWVVDKKKPNPNKWYMLAYSGFEYKVLFKAYQITSPVILVEQLFDRVVSYGVSVNTYRSFCKKLKPTLALKAEFKGHELYKTFNGISGYAERCLKMALKVYLLERCGRADLELSKAYPFASDILDYFRAVEKPKDVSVKRYVMEMMKELSK
ncbi:MAG: hypothetical protein FWG67_09435 [Defluviitaleaceae bacterium]|nr:hypothetical protein [Defluviitaleaceae bacterium]